jgi:hypothetical protein
MRFDTFADIKNWYDNTTPIISKHHNAKCDIRPVGLRRNKWERIVKINDNKYAITDGSWCSMPYTPSTDADLAFGVELAEKLGAIMWEKRGNDEYLHIRGCVNSGYSIGRYKMLNYHLPSTLRHTDKQPAGKHFIIDTTGGSPYNQYPLPRMKAVIEWQNCLMTSYEDNSLTFKRIADANGKTTAWERVGEVMVQGTTLDLDRKKHLKPALKSFYEWMTAVQPLISTDFGATRQFNALMAEGLGIDNFWGGHGTDLITPAFAVAVITDEDSPYRLAFAATLLRSMGVRVCPSSHQQTWVYTDEVDEWGYRKGSWVEGAPFTEEETAAWYKKENKRIKSSYNRYMNKMLGLFNEVAV